MILRKSTFALLTVALLSVTAFSQYVVKTDPNADL